MTNAVNRKRAKRSSSRRVSCARRVTTPSMRHQCRCARAAQGDVRLRSAVSRDTLLAGRRAVTVVVGRGTANTGSAANFIARLHAAGRRLGGRAPDKSVASDESVVSSMRARKTVDSKMVAHRQCSQKSSIARRCVGTKIGSVRQLQACISGESSSAGRAWPRTDESLRVVEAGAQDRRLENCRAWTGSPSCQAWTTRSNGGFFILVNRRTWRSVRRTPGTGCSNSWLGLQLEGCFSRASSFAFDGAVCCKK